MRFGICRILLGSRAGRDGRRACRAGYSVGASGLRAVAGSSGGMVGRFFGSVCRRSRFSLGVGFHHRKEHSVEDRLAELGPFLADHGGQTGIPDLRCRPDRLSGRRDGSHSLTSHPLPAARSRPARSNLLPVRPGDLTATHPRTCEFAAYRCIYGLGSYVDRTTPWPVRGRRPRTSSCVRPRERRRPCE